jgi:poly-gamma-glutamate biosynthesis protein PgsC/CapC
MILAQSIALGLFIGFVFFECSGLVAGGLVTPGYLALCLDQPRLLAECFGSALAAFCLVRLLALCTILYGRRRFIVTILAGFCLQWAAGSLLWGIPLAESRIDAVGYIIPGLLAHEMLRQGIGKTLLALFVVTALVRVALAGLGIA